MKFIELKNDLESEYNKVFRKSKMIVRASNNLYKCIYIDCYLAGNKDELINGYAQNDMFHISFRIDTENGEFTEKVTDDTILPENLVLENMSKSISIVPENRFLAYSSVDVPFRKVKGDCQKMVNAFEKFVIRLYQKVAELEKDGKIHDNFKNLVADKIH